MCSESTFYCHLELERYFVLVSRLTKGIEGWCVCVKRDARHPSCKLQVHTAGAQPKCHLLLSDNGWPTGIEHEAGVMIFFLNCQASQKECDITTTGGPWAF